MHRQAVTKPGSANLANQFRAAFGPGRGDNLGFYPVALYAVKSRRLMCEIEDTHRNQECTAFDPRCFSEIELYVRVFEDYLAGGSFIVARFVFDEGVLEFEFGRESNVIREFVAEKGHESM